MPDVAWTADADAPLPIPKPTSPHTLFRGWCVLPDEQDALLLLQMPSVVAQRGLVYKCTRCRQMGPKAQMSAHVVEAHQGPFSISIQACLS